MKRRSSHDEAALWTNCYRLLFILITLGVSQQKKAYISFELKDAMIMIPGIYDPVPITLGSIIWGDKEIVIGVNNAKPRGTMTDGNKTYPLSEPEATMMLEVINWLADYRYASDAWFQGGGSYKQAIEELPKDHKL